MSLAILGRLLPLVLLPVIGYIWPLPGVQTFDNHARSWHWPEAQPAEPPEPNPALLVRFWPVQKNTTTGKSDSQHEPPSTRHEARALQLVAVVRQGERLQALVLLPDGRLNTLAPGENLDEHRRITAIEPTQLHWQDGTEQGRLVLFPRPDVTDNTNE